MYQFGAFRLIYLHNARCKHSQRQAMYVQRNNEARLINYFYLGKGISIKYSECVSVALVIYQAMRMLLVILSSVACLVLPYFSSSSHKQHDFRGNVIEHKIFVFVVSKTLSETYLVLRRE